MTNKADALLFWFHSGSWSNRSPKSWPRIRTLNPVQAPRELVPGGFRSSTELIRQLLTYSPWEEVIQVFEPIYGMEAASFHNMGRLLHAWRKRQCRLRSNFTHVSENLWSDLECRVCLYCCLAMSPETYYSHPREHSTHEGKKILSPYSWPVMSLGSCEFVTRGISTAFNGTLCAIMAKPDSWDFGQSSESSRSCILTQWSLRPHRFCFAKVLQTPVNSGGVISPAGK